MEQPFSDMFLLTVVIVAAVLISGGRKTLKPLFYLLSVLLGLPSFLFAAACLVFHRAVERGTLLEFFDAILSFVIAMYPWGAAIMLLCLVILIAAGFRSRWRRVAAGVVIALVLGSAGTIHWLAGLPDDSGQWWCLVPGFLSFIIASWLFTAPRSGLREFAFQYPNGPLIGRTLQEQALEEFRESLGLKTVNLATKDWGWYALPPFQDGSWRMGVELGFQKGILRQISFFHDDPAFYRASQGENASGTEEQRAENSRKWLQSKEYQVGLYAWGEIWASYDPRSDFGYVGIRYAPCPQRRGVPLVPASVMYSSSTN